MKNTILLMLCLTCTIGLVTGQQVSFALDDLNPNNFNTDFTEYDQPTAVFCAQISNLVYYDLSEIDQRVELLRARHPEDSIRYRFITQVGSHHPLTPDQVATGDKRRKLQKKKTESEVLIFATKRFAVISFRGTSSFKDIKTDLRFRTFGSKNDGSENPRQLPAGHNGFRLSLIDLIDQHKFFDQLGEMVDYYKADPKNYPIFLTGHSLGGALAIMAIKPLQFNNEFQFGGAYTFAPAMAVADSSVYAYENEKDRIHNIINHTDIVPRLNRNRGNHIGKYYRFSAYRHDMYTKDDGALYQEKVRHIKFLRREKMVIIGTVLKYHSLDRYIERIKLPYNNTKAVLARGLDARECIYKGSKVKKKDCPYFPKVNRAQKKTAAPQGQ